MGTYYIPRNVKGEGRILFIFTGKSLMYTAVGVAIGFPIYFIISYILQVEYWGLLALGIGGLIGFGIGTLKIPKISILKNSQDIAGENIDEIIKRYYSFKKHKNKIYVNKTEEEVKQNVWSSTAI